MVLMWYILLLYLARFPSTLTKRDGLPDLLVSAQPRRRYRFSFADVSLGREHSMERARRCFP